MKPKRWQLLLLSVLVIASMMFTVLPMPVQIGPLSFGGAGVARATDTTIQPSTADANIMQYYPTTNYGSDTSFSLFDYGGFYRRIFLKFSTSTIPVGATVSAATFSVYLGSYDTTYDAAKEIKCKRVTSAWTEGAVTWNTAPTVTDTDQATATTVHATTGWVNFNVLALVQDAIANRSDVLDVRLSFTTETGISSVPFFYSKEYATDTTLRPKLVVTYTPPLLTITTLPATSITTTSVTLNGNVTEINSGGNVTSYGFVLSTTTQSNPGNVSPSAQTTYTAGNWTYTALGGGYAVGTTFDSNGNVTGLIEDTCYYFRAAGYSTYGWVYGDELIIFRPSIAENWLSGWGGHRINITSISCKIDGNLTDFAFTLVLDSSVGETAVDVTSVFDELTTDANRMKIAVTQSDGTTELYVEIEKWDDTNEKAVLHCRGNLTDTPDSNFYLYYDSTHTDNTAYVGDYNPDVWDSSSALVLHLGEMRAPSVTITEVGTIFDADDVVGGAGNYTEDVVIIKAQDGLFYMFTDRFLSGGAGWNNDIYAIRASNAGFTTDVTFCGKVIERDYSRVFAQPIYDPVRQEYILYVINWASTASHYGPTHAYYCSKANFEAGDAGAGDWVDAGAILALGGASAWDEHFAAMNEVGWDASLSKWVCYYEGVNTSNVQGIGKASSSDPRGTFTKDAGNPIVLMTAYTVGSTWHDYGLDFAPRAWYRGNDAFNVVFCEGLVSGASWRIGTLIQPKNHLELLYDASNSPQLGSGSGTGYANPSAVIEDGGVLYLYYQTTDAGYWYNYKVATFTIGTTLGNPSSNKSLANSINLDYRASKKALGEPTVAAGIVGDAQHFDGSNDYAAMVSSAILNPTTLTLSFYFKLDVVVASQPCSTMMLVSKYTYGDNKGYGVFIEKSTNLITWRAYINGGWRDVTASSAGFAAGVWYRFDGVYDGQYLRMYVDNVEVGTAYDAGSAKDITQGTKVLYLSSYDGSADTTIDGLLDEVKLSAGARSAAWRTAEYYGMADNLFVWGTEENVTPDISNTPSLWSVGVVQPSQTYWANGNGNNQDYTTYTEIDPNSHISKTSSVITYTNLTYNEDAYVYKDFGVNHFNGDFHFYMDEYLSPSSDLYTAVIVWGVANDLDDWNGFQTGNKSILDIRATRTSSTSIQFNLDEIDSGSVWGESDSYSDSQATTFYFDIWRDESIGTYGNLTCDIYISSTDRVNQTNLLDKLSISLHTSKKDYRYLYGLNSVNIGEPEAVTGWMSNLQIITTWPISDNDCWGNLTNNSSFAVDISASMTDMTGGTTWSIGSSPGTNVFTLKIGIAGKANIGNFTTLSNTPVAWITSMAAGNMTRWTMVFYTPTNSPQFADGTPKSGNITFEAEAS